MLRTLYRILPFLLLSTALAGCGYTREDHILSGAAIGAGVGAVALDRNPLEGAVIGGAVGAGAGALSR
jgi:osmotically inducible lipoprotein OsmB